MATRYEDLSPELQQRYDRIEKEKGEFSTMDMVKNIPSSAAGVAKDMYQSIRHPIDTFTGITDAMAGGIYKGAEAMGVPVDYNDPDISKRSQSAEAVADMVKERYGSWEKAAQTLEKDPVGFLSDLSMVGSGAAKAGKLAGMPKAGIAGDIAQAIDPINMAMTAPKAAVKAAAAVSNPVEMYLSAAKLPTTLDIKKGYGHRKELAETALKHEIMPTMKGAEKIGDIIHGYDKQMDALIDAAEVTGGKVPITRVAQNLGGLRSNVSGFKWKSKKNLTAIDSAAKEFFEDMDAQGITEVGVKQLQKFKQDLYKQLNYDAKRGKLENIKSQTGKAFAGGARKEIEKMIPEVKGINKEWGKLIDLQEPLFRAAGRIGNRDTMGIGLPIKAHAGSAAFGAPGLAAGLAAGIADIPTVKAFSAIKLNKVKKQSLFDALSVDPSIHAAGQALFQGGRIQDY